MKDKRGFSPVIIIIILTVLLAGAVGVFIWRKDSDKKSSDANEQAAQEESANQSASSTEEPEDIPVKQALIADVDMRLQKSSDVSQLPESSPDSFKTFIQARIEGFECDYAEFPTGGVYLTKISARFVQGGISCGGGAAVTWYFQSNEWHEFGYQDTVPCEAVVSYEIPTDFIPECLNGEEVIANPNGPLDS